MVTVFFYTLNEIVALYPIDDLVYITLICLLTMRLFHLSVTFLFANSKKRIVSSFERRLYLFQLWINLINLAFTITTVFTNYWDNKMYMYNYWVWLLVCTNVFQGVDLYLLIWFILTFSLLFFSF